MSVSYRTRGLVLKKEDRQDADRVFTVFTQDFGRVELFAKSIRAITSKLRSGMELFYVSDIEFVQGKNRKTLTDALAMETFGNIPGEPEKFKTASAIAATAELFLKNPQSDDQVWQLLIHTFEELNTNSANDKFLYYYFFWNFVSLLGYEPHLSVCVVCQEPLAATNIYFSCQEGGVACQSCGAAKPGFKKINADVVKILRLIVKKELPTLYKLKIQVASKKLLKEVSDDYRNYLKHTVG